MNVLDIVTNNGVFSSTPQKKPSYDGYLDGLYADMTKSSEDVAFVNTLETVMNKNRADKMKMCVRLSAVYGKESLRNSNMFSTESAFIKKIALVIVKIIDAIKNFFNRIFQTLVGVIIKKQLKDITALAKNEQDTVLPPEAVTPDIIKNVVHDANNGNDITKISEIYKNLYTTLIQHSKVMSDIGGTKTFGGDISLPSFHPDKYPVLYKLLNNSSVDITNKSPIDFIFNLVHKMFGTKVETTEDYLKKVKISDIKTAVFDLHKVVNIKLVPLMREFERYKRLVVNPTNPDIQDDPKDKLIVVSIKIMSEIIFLIQLLLQSLLHSMMGTLKLGIAVRRVGPEKAVNEFHSITIKIIPNNDFTKTLDGIFGEVSRMTTDLNKLLKDEYIANPKM